jgi:hypothetical protein
MASSDFSLTRVVHNPRIPTKTATPVATPTTTDSSASGASTAPSFTAVFAALSAQATAAGTTVATTAPPPAGSTKPNAATAAPAPVATPADDATDDPAGPLFGANPWLTDPTGSGPGGGVTNYNPIYFATPQTAQTVAQMVGGTVVSTQVFTPSPGSPFQQNQPNLMVQLPNGGLINPGLVADIYTHGWNQSFVNQQVANEVAGAQPAAINT